MLYWIYSAIAVAVWGRTATELSRTARPRTLGERVGGTLACAVIATAWPVALLWRLLLGPDPESRRHVSHPLRGTAAETARPRPPRSEPT
jgi:hypothetical protein